MAGANLLALIDDIATLLEDVALMTKVATQKTAGVLGDDLAVNAQKVAGVDADRELPVVWAVFLGSLRNKAILVPAALLISAFIPVAITPILAIGALYLCYEGFEKVAHYFEREDPQEHQRLVDAVIDPKVDLVAYEKEKIGGAIRTDFILSAEIIAITLGSVAQSSITQQIIVLSIVAIALTIGVYGFVAAIVKMDDLGMVLEKRGNPWRTLGKGLINAAPYLMRFLAIAGTIAMFLVGGGILVHSIHPFAHFQSHLSESDGLGKFFAHAVPAVVGIIAGALTLLGAIITQWLKKKIKKAE